jgi:dTDP-4-dehydrorhamnose 3,5-epimerase
MKEKMKISTFEIEGLVLIEPRLFSDDRGVFYETFQVNQFKEFISEDVNFVQDNESVSKKNVLRGLHFQNPPYAQGKLVRVVSGSVLDVAVDLRKDSPTYGKHQKVVLSGENKHLFWIPKGFAHGFLALEENTIFHYKCTDFYHPPSEQTILWNDETLSIDWQITDPIVSTKDQEGLKFSQFETPFI